MTDPIVKDPPLETQEVMLPEIMVTAKRVRPVFMSSDVKFVTSMDADKFPQSMRQELDSLATGQNPKQKETNGLAKIQPLKTPALSAIEATQQFPQELQNMGVKENNTPNPLELKPLSGIAALSQEARAQIAGLNVPKIIVNAREEIPLSAKEQRQAERREKRENRREDRQERRDAIDELKGERKEVRQEIRSARRKGDSNMVGELKETRAGITDQLADMRHFGSQLAVAVRELIDDLSFEETAKNHTPTPSTSTPMPTKVPASQASYRQ